MTNPDSIVEPGGRVPVVRRADLVVVGGGPAGIAAAVAGARNGLSVTLIERYAYLGGLASGGMVLVLDDMCNGDGNQRARPVRRDDRAHGAHRPVRHAAANPSAAPTRRCGANGRAGACSTFIRTSSRSRSATPPRSIPTASSASPMRWSARRRSTSGCIAGSRARSSRTAASPASSARPRADARRSWATIVVDASGDLDVAASAGAPFTHGSYIVTTVFRLGGVDVEAAERFEYEQPAAFHAIDREAKKIMGGSWDKWWLKTPLPGIVWCNCPHMTGLDGLKRRGPHPRRLPGARAHRRAGRFRARQDAGVRTRPSSSTSRRRSACARRACSTASMS